MSVNDAKMDIEGPAFSSSLRVNESFLSDELGVWGAESEFVSEDGTAKFSSKAATFRPLEIGTQSLFTWGAENQIRFTERPMWVSAHQSGYGEPIVLNMSDGDTTGQQVFVSKEWLWKKGIHRPIVEHEDGSNLNATPVEDRTGWVIDMHHFSYVMIEASEQVVYSDQLGLIGPHTGEVRWYPEDEKLEIDVGFDCAPHVISCSSIGQTIYVDKDWLDFKISDLAIAGFEWTIDLLHHDDFYKVEIDSTQTPTTLVYLPFAPFFGDYLFTSGSKNSVYLTEYSGFLKVFYDENNLTVDVVEGNLPFDFGVVQINASWLRGLDILYPAVYNNNTVFPMILAKDIIYIEAIFPSAILNNGVIDISIEEAELCEELYDFDPIHVGSFEPMSDAPNAWANGYLALDSFCWEWNLTGTSTMPDPDGYQVWGVVWEGEGGMLNEESICRAGSLNDMVFEAATMVCTWPESKVYGGEITMNFLGSGGKPEDVFRKEKAKSAWDDCWQGVGIGISAYGISFPLLACTKAISQTSNLWGESEKFIWSTVIADSLQVNLDDEIGTNEVTLSDLDTWNAPRLDTWNFVEDDWSERPSGYDGRHRILWTLENVVDAEITYDSDLSIPNWINYNDQVMTLSWYAGGADGEATVDTFPAANNREEINTRHANNVDPSLDWQAPEPHCVLIHTIASKVFGNDEFINLGDYAINCDTGNLRPDPPNPPNPPNLPGIPNPGEILMEFTVFDHSLEPAQLLIPIGSSGNITIDDVIASDGNITRAIAKQITSNQSFIDNITHVTAPTHFQESGSCAWYHEPYEAIFSAMVTGNTIAGNLPTFDESIRTSTICFDPLRLTILAHSGGPEPE